MTIKGKIRVILASSDSGEEEIVVFTADLSGSPKNHIPNSVEVTADIISEMTLPNEFPLEYVLQRR